MPDTYVKLPDGSYAQFPEGTSDADIESALKSFAEPAPASQAKPSATAAPAMTFAIVNGRPVAVGESPGSVKDTAAEFAPATGATIGGALGGPPGAYAGYVLGQVARDVTQHGAEVPGAYADVKRLLQNPETRSATLKGLLEGTTSGLLNYVPGMRAALQGAQEARAGRPVTGAIDVGLGGLEAATMGQAGVLGNLFRTAPVKTTAQTLAALGAGHYGGKAAKHGAEQLGASEDVAGAAQRVGNLGGNILGVGVGKAAENPKVRQAFSGTMADRAKSAGVAAYLGYETGGPKGAVAGAAAGALLPGVGWKKPAAMLREAFREAKTEEAKTPATIAEQRQQRIDNGVKLADQVRSVDTLTMDEATKVLSELDKSIGAFEANKSPVPQSVRDAQQKAETIVRTAEIAKAREQGQAVLTSTKTQQNIADLKSLLGPEALNGNIGLLESSPSAARSYYNEVARVLAKYDAAGEQPPAEFVQAFDYLHDMVLKDKSIDAGAYDAAIESLTTAASKGPKAFAAAVQAIPAKTMNIVRTVGNDIFTGLQSASRNAGGALVEGQPSESWMVKTMRDVLDMDRAPAETSELGGMNVPTQAAAAGGAATVPSGVGGRRVGRNWVSETELPTDVADAAAQAVEAQSDVSKAKGRRSPSERAASRGEALKTDTSQLSAQRVQQIKDQQVFFSNALRFRQLLDAFYATPKPQRTKWLLQRSEAGAPSNANLLSDLHNDIFKSKSKIVTPQDVVTHTQFEGAMNNPQFRPYLKKLFKSLKKD